MDVILQKLIEDAQALAPKFNSQAFYLPNRESFIDWMNDLAERLRV